MQFKFTDTQRTRKSFESFATGLFGRNNIDQVWYPQPLKLDPVLRFYKLCHRWSVEVDKNPTALNSLFEWHRGPEMNRALASVATKSGIHDLTLGKCFGFIFWETVI